MKPRIGAGLLVLLILPAALAWAQAANGFGDASGEPPRSQSLEDRLLDMQRRMEQYERELDILRSRMAPDTDPSHQAPSQPASLGEASSAAPAPGVASDRRTQTEEAEIITKPTYKLRGRLFFDHVMYTDDPALGLDRENETGFDTARIGLSGNIFENVQYMFELEFEGEEVDFKSTYAEINQLPLVGNFRGGYFYEPISGLDEVSGSNYQMFMERSLSTTAFNPSRGWGVLAWRYLEGPDVYLGVGAFRQNNDDSPPGRAYVRGDSGDWALTSRVAWTPYYDEPSGGRYLVHLGLGYSYRTDPDGVAFSTVAELGNQRGFLASTVPGDKNYSLFVPEFLLIWGRFSAQSEWYFVTTGPANYWGGYVEASWFLTGDHRGYDREQKILTRPEILEDFFTTLLPSGWCTGSGAWELTMRWSHVDMREGTDPLPVVTPSRGLQNNYLAGVNWYLNSYTRIMFNYLYEDVNLASGLAGNTHTFGARLQVHW